MAATPLTVTTLAYTSAATADPATNQTTDAVNGNSVPNGGKTMLRVQNADASNPHTLTMKYAKKYDGQDVTGRAYTIAANSTKWIPVGPVAYFGSTAVFTVDSNQIKVTPFVMS
jgi:hypothetical protein